MRESLLKEEQRFAHALTSQAADTRTPAQLEQAGCWDGRTWWCSNVKRKTTFAAGEQLPIIPTSLTIAHWWIDYSAGSSGNSGTVSSSPINGLAELAARFGPLPWRFQPELVVVTVTNSAGSTTDAIDVDTAQNFLALEGVPTVVTTGTLSAVQPKSRTASAPTQWVVAAGATLTAGDLFVDTTQSAYAWVNVVSGTSALLTQPMAQNINPFFSAFPAEKDVLTAGDSWSEETAPQVYLNSIGAAASVLLLNLTVQGATESGLWPVQFRRGYLLAAQTKFPEGIAETGLAQGAISNVTNVAANCYSAGDNYFYNSTNVGGYYLDSQWAGQENLLDGDVFIAHGQLSNEPGASGNVINIGYVNAGNPSGVWGLNQAILDISVYPSIFNEYGGVGIYGSYLNYVSGVIPATGFMAFFLNDAGSAFAPAELQLPLCTLFSGDAAAASQVLCSRALTGQTFDTQADAGGCGGSCFNPSQPSIFLTDGGSPTGH